ncbi:MAG: P-loop NTPase [Gemmatimonadota bacterium]
MRKIRTYHEVDDEAGREVLDQVLAQRDRLARRLADVRHVVAVASGKGGVGKSAVTANLAALLTARGHRVGAVDADLNGPSLARMLGADRREPLHVGEDGVSPATGATTGVRVISMDLLLEAEETPVAWRGAEGSAMAESIWRGSIETGALREFLGDIAWGELDYLFVDVPPGTDRLARLLDLVPRPDALLLVTTPSEAARFVVAKSVRQAADAGLPTVGLVANMTAYVCEGCGHAAPLFPADGARRLAEAADAPLWAEIPFDPRLAVATDAGRPYGLDGGDSPAAIALRTLADRLETETADGETAP